MENDWISFGEVARRMCGMQAQYCSRYVGGLHGRPDLGEGLRFQGAPAQYHQMKIHRADADVFVARLRDHRINNHCGWSGEE